MGTTTKVTFYLLTALPEFIVAAMILSLNLKTEFGIGVTDARKLPKEGSEVQLSQV